MHTITHKTNYSFCLPIILASILSFSCQKGDVGLPGPAGPKSLLSIQPLAAGAACATGGITVLSGIDKNNNGKLDSTEVDQAQNVCNGLTGPPGLKSVLDIQPLAPGAACANGGVIILSGIDLNSNGKLDSTEVDHIQNVCNGATGPSGLKSLLDIQPLPAGSVCESGGIVIRSGIDKNGSGKLDNDEVDQIQNVCSGSGGINSGEQDKQIVLPLGGSKSIGQIPGIGQDPIIKFKKSNYGGVDSIVFIAVPYVSDPYFQAVVDLYNVTDDSVVAGSEIVSNQLLNVNGFVQTGNIYNQLPDKEITLVTRTRSTREGGYAGCYYAYLVLYRK
jgi:hypothetical protein